MSDLGPLDHISRLPLPWREHADLTECGKPIAELAARVVTRAEVEARIKRVGKQRAAFTTCMTCAQTSDRWSAGHYEPSGPIGAVVRECGDVRHATPPRRDSTVHREREHERAVFTWERRRRFEAELEALAVLVAAHREEFEGYLTGLGDTVSLAERRRTRKVAR